MKNQIRLEEAAMFGLSILLFTLTGAAWWIYPALLLVPDIGMLGYLANPKMGAWIYNIFHHKGIAVLLMAIGWLVSIEWVLIAGIILFGHISMDRIFGYGLKYPDNFKHTHLGWIGKT